MPSGPRSQVPQGPRKPAREVLPQIAAMPNLHPSRAVPIVLQLLGWMLLLAFAATPARGQSTADSGTIDPPGRVGSLSLLAGPVTMIDLNTGSREEALLNWPVTGGWRIETGRTARAEVRIGSSALRLDDETTVDFVRLDDNFMQIAVLRGSLSLRIRNREVLDELELLTGCTVVVDELELLTGIVVVVNDGT